MKLLKLEIGTKDTKSIYYVADDVYSMGSVTKHPKQAYSFAVKISKTIDGKKIYKRKVKKFTKPTTFVRALEEMQKIRTETKHQLIADAPLKVAILKGEVAPSSVDLENAIDVNQRTLYEAWLDFYKTKEEKKLSAQTLATYRTYFSTHIQPVLGSQLIHEIETDDIQRIINKMISDGLAPRSAQYIQQILRPLFNKELHTKGTLLVTNPALNVSLPRFNNEVTINITDEQRKALFAEINSYADERIRSIFIWLTHGRRSNEVRSLQWENIDLENGTYTIIAENNKARKSMTYKMTVQQLEALPDVEDQSGYVFPSFKDASLPMSNHTLRPHWTKILENAKIDHLRLHDLRHIIGGELVSAGYSLEQVASVLGHSSTDVTKRYSKVRENVANEAITDFFSRVES